MALSHPVLYSFRRCPYAMRARLAIRSCGLTVELREVLLRDKPQAMIDASPKATVPVLVLADGTVIDESLDIMRWAVSRSETASDYGRDAETCAALIGENDGPFKQALDRYKYPDRFGLDRQAANDHRAKGVDFIRTLDSILAGSAALSGETFGFCDHAIASFVRQFAHVDRDWFAAGDWPHAARWLEAFKASDDFAAIMVKHPQWTQGAEPVLFGRTVEDRAAL